MIKMYDSEMTAGAVRKIEERAGKKIDKLLKDELKELMYEMKEEEEIQADADLNYVWLETECKSICSLPEKDCLSRVEELNIYVSISEENGDYDTYNGYNNFLDFYLGRDYLIFTSEDDVAVLEESFQNNLKDIIWYDEDNELKRTLDEELNQIKNDEEGEDLIKFVGNNITTLINEISEYSDNDYEIIGYYSGEKIYRIKKRLYYLTDDSGTCNTENYWFLQELGPNGYEYFQMENLDNEEKKIEKDYDEILSGNLNEVISKIYEENEYSTTGTQLIFEKDSDAELYEEFLEKLKEERQDIWNKIHENIGLEEIYDSSEVVENFGDTTFYKIDISGYIEGNYASAVQTYLTIKKSCLIDEFGVIKTYIYVENF